MLKKLDKLILKAFAGPFLLTFAVVQFILLTHTLLKYLDDIIGKDLGTGVLLQLLFYFSVLIVPISLPLAVLLSSLMTYGNLGEHHELTAIKASGIALTRILRPVLLLTAALAVGAFWFNETIVPKANLKAYSLLWDVRQQKLALDIREGVFYNGIPGYTIKVDKKTGRKRRPAARGHDLRPHPEVGQCHRDAGRFGPHVHPLQWRLPGPGAVSRPQLRGAARRVRTGPAPALSARGSTTTWSRFRWPRSDLNRTPGGAVSAKPHDAQHSAAALRHRFGAEEAAC